MIMHNLYAGLLYNEEAFTLLLWGDLIQVKVYYNVSHVYLKTIANEGNASNFDIRNLPHISPSEATLWSFW